MLPNCCKDKIEYCSAEVIIAVWLSSIQHYLRSEFPFVFIRFSINHFSFIYTSVCEKAFISYSCLASFIQALQISPLIFIKYFFMLSIEIIIIITHKIKSKISFVNEIKNEND